MQEISPSAPSNPTSDEWQSHASTTDQASLRLLSSHIAALAPDCEWIFFAERYLLDPDTSLRNPEHISLA